MKASNYSTDQLKAVIEYILWDYDHNVNSFIAEKQPEIVVQEFGGLFHVKIKYIAETIIAINRSEDPTTHKQDTVNLADGQFTLLKTESFYQLTKYVHDICEEMAK